MIPHHEQAVEMSDVVLAKQGIDPRVTDLGHRDQGRAGAEIKEMQDWLGQWGNPPMPPMRREGHGGHDMDGCPATGWG